MTSGTTRRLRLHRIALAAAALVSLSALAAQAQSGVGQTFTAPAAPNTLLQSISVSSYSALAGTTNTFSIFAFNGTNTVGSALFQQMLTGPNSGVSFTPGITLSPGSSYLFLTTVTSETSVGRSTDNPFAGGQFVICTAGTCSGNATDDMTGFSVTFGAAPVTTTPEPSSMALLGTGLVGLVPMVRRRRRS